MTKTNCQREFEKFAKPHGISKTRGVYDISKVDAWWFVWKTAWALAYKLGNQNALKPICDQLKIETPEDWKAGFEAAKRGEK